MRSNKDYKIRFYDGMPPTLVKYTAVFLRFFWSGVSLGQCFRETNLNMKSIVAAKMVFRTFIFNRKIMTLISGSTSHVVF